MPKNYVLCCNGHKNWIPRVMQSHEGEITSKFPLIVLNHFFETKVLEEARANWNNHLGHLVDDMPDFDTVIMDLRAPINKLLS